jgi:DNA repair protein RadC
MSDFPDKTSIKCWAEEDRPREKLMLKGRHTLSDAELLAILLGTGNFRETAVDLAKKILAHFHGNLVELSRAGIHDLTGLKGIGPVKAISILAAMELGRRRNEAEVLSREKITSSNDAYQILRSTISDQPWEEFWIILLNRANRVIRKCMISEGGISGTVVDPKKIFKIALDHHATSIILGHNHPSGSVEPSDADIQITKKIRDAGALLDVAVLDHVIIGDDRFYSFADNGAI